MSDNTRRAAAATVQEVHQSEAASTGVRYSSASALTSRTTHQVNLGNSFTRTANTNTLRNNRNMRETFQLIVQTVSQRFVEGIGESFDLPTLARKFGELDWKKKCLVILGIIAAGGLIGWVSWRLVCWVFPIIVDFMNSEIGVQLTAQLSNCFPLLRSSGFVMNFANVLDNTSESASAQVGQGVHVTEVVVDEGPLQSVNTQLQDLAVGRIPEQLITIFISAYFAFIQSRISQQQNQQH